MSFNLQTVVTELCSSLSLPPLYPKNCDDTSTCKTQCVQGHVFCKLINCRATMWVKQLSRLQRCTKFQEVAKLSGPQSAAILWLPRVHLLILQSFLLIPGKVSLKGRVVRWLQLPFKTKSSNFQVFFFKNIGLSFYFD